MFILEEKTAKKRQMMKFSYNGNVATIYSKWKFEFSFLISIIACENFFFHRKCFLFYENEIKTALFQMSGGYFIQNYKVFKDNLSISYVNSII